MDHVEALAVEKIVFDEDIGVDVAAGIGVAAPEVSVDVREPYEVVTEAVFDRCDDFSRAILVEVLEGLDRRFRAGEALILVVGHCGGRSENEGEECSSDDAGFHGLFPHCLPWRHCLGGEANMACRSVRGC